MRDVEIPDWLKGLPLAPEFRPTDTEFADPIAYISKIEKEASAFGICKVIPPLPKPSKKYVISNLNKTLSKCPELGSDVNLSGVYSSSNNGDKDKENGMEVLRAVFTTRQQELGQDIKKTKGSVHPQSPAVHKQVWQSGEVYTLEQFESKSKVFARSQLASVKDVSPIVIEALFWEAASEKPIYVEYANDVPGSGFGEPEGHFKYFRRRRRRRGSFDRNKKYLGESLGNSHTPFIEASRPSSSSFSPSGLSNQILKDSKKVDIEVEGTAGWKLSNSPWNLQVIARSPGSLTRFMPDDIPGVTSPMVYIGMLFSWFAWHVEDHELHSLNFLHTGSSKTWYAVPGDYAFVFEEVIRTQAYGGNIDRFTALKLLGEKTSLLSPEIVVAAGIPCCRLVQNPGEFVVTFPRAYHVGFSHGFNCGEAANFGTPRWLTVAKEAAVRRAAMNFLPMLSHQQLLYLLAMSFVSRVPRSLLPGARSSRLRDRQKEEREFLVKKALIEDILNENNLLTLLLQKNPSYRTVLWDVDLLPSSSSKESETRSSITTDPSALINGVSPQIDQDQDLLTQMSSYMENLNDLYLDDDMSCDLEVDSGTMPCLACGILGFPFMTVVQPLDQASMNIMAKDDCKIEDRGVFKPLESNSLICRKLTIKGPTPPIQDDIDNKDKTINHSSKNFEKSSVNAQSFSSVTAGLMKFDETHLPKEVPLDKGWNTSTGLLRPRIFCLEHALEVEKLLRPKGGANVLVICHSDFQKIKAQAAAIAEEIKISFNYKEIQLDNATPEDLNLINLAVDNEEHDDEFKEDWTFKLGVNLRQSMKVRTNFPNQKLQISLNLVGLFPNSISISISNDLNLMWRSRKYRSKRNLNRLIRHKSAERLPEMIGAKSLRKEGELLKYSRRSNKSKLCGFSMGSKGSSDCENLEKNVGNVENRVCNSSVCGETEKHGQNLLENGTGETENMGNTCLEVAESGKIELESETQAGVQTEKSLLLEVVDSEMLGSGCEESEEIGCNQLKNGAGETENMGNPCLDVAGSGNSDLQHATPASVSREKSLTLKAVDSEMSVSGCEESEKNGSIETENARNPSLEVAGSGKFELQRETPVSVLGEKSPPLRVVDSEMSVSVCFEESENNDRNWSENGAREPENIGSPCLELAGSGKSDLQHETPASVSTEELGEKSLPAKVGEINDRNRSETGTGNTKNAQNPCRESELKHETPVTDEHIPMNDVSNNLSSDKKVVRNRNKRKREMDLIEEDQICFNGFTRSPCEGLRPRSTKDVNKPIPKKPKPKLQKKIMEKKGSGTSFRCTIKGCRKKFRSHKYAVLHQRVHEDDRPLKCPWKGCGVSFKWAWARTEHIRVHTGERPYECKVEGCGLTFRFISDYSRHKRKTGHYVDSQS